MLRLSHIAAPAVLGLSLLVGGCANQRHDEIPASATMAVEGDERLTYLAPYDGKVFVYDTNDERLVYSGDVEKGDEIMVDPDNESLMVDGRTAMEDGLRDGHRHQIFFEKQDDPDKKTVIMEETTIKRTN